VILFLLCRAHVRRPEPREGSVRIVTQADLDRITAAYDRRSKAADWGEAYYIPTGLFIESVEFLGPYNVRVFGYVWQCYPDTVPPEVRRGVIFPEAEKQNLDVSYRIREGGAEVIGWSFVANLRQEFEYARYPFDCQEVWIRLWPLDFENNVVLIPDFASYGPWEAREKPGLEKRFVLEGWAIQEAYFSSQLASYNTSFGVVDYAGQVDTPELCYNVGIRRAIVTPLLTHGVAPLVVYVLVFVTFLMFSADKERRGHFGLTWSGVIGVWSGSLFATLIAQASLRGQLKAAGLAYLEALHILLYPTIVGAACVATLCVAAPEIRLLKWRDNVLAKQLYWPVVMFIPLLVTLITF
jgi:hypothetical protein